MKLKPATLLLLLLPTFIFAQQKTETPAGSIVGVVKDSANDYGLEAVTVLLYKKSDSSLLNYQLTNTAGEFNFQQVPLNVPIIVSLTFSGFKSFSKIITLDSLKPAYNFNTIKLNTNFKALDEVVITAVVPIRMNGDTLEINPAAFKLDSNAVVEDMLRKVPGITLWGDGTVTVNGKKVTNVYVDGKPFFGNDPAIATQNLPKNAIEKIQVYTEEDRTKSAAERTAADSLLTMNIKLKADKKKGYFGKGSAGIGTDKRFEADLGLQAFNKKTRLGIGGAINNINKNVDDLQSLLGETTFRSFNPRNRYVANFAGRGVNKFYFLGANLQHSFIETTNNQRSNELDFDLTGRGTINYVNSQSDAITSAAGNSFYKSSIRNSTQENDTKTFSVSYNKRDIDKDLNLRASVNDNVGFGNSNGKTVTEREGKGVVSESNEFSESETKSRSLSFGGNFLNKDSDERNLKSFSLRFNANYSENESIRKSLSDLVSFEDPGRNTSFNRLYNTNSSNWNGTVNVTYNALKRLLFGSNNLWNINMRLTNNLNIGQSDLTYNVSDFDSVTKFYVGNAKITNIHQSNRISEEPALNLSKSFSKRLSNRYFRTITISTNLGGQFLREKDQSNFANRNLTRDFIFFTPNSNINYYYQKANGYNVNASLSHNINYSIPGLDQLYPIIDSANLYSFNYGNASLSPSKSNTFGINLNYGRGGNRNKKADINFGINGNYVTVRNDVADSSFYDSLGRKNVYLINIDGRSNWNIGGNFNTSIRLKKNVLQFTYNGSINNSRSPNYIDNIFSTSRIQNINNSLRVYFAVGEIVNFSVSQGINMSNSIQTGANLRSFKNKNYITSANINLQYPKDFTLSNTLNYVKNTTTNQTSALWNAFLSYRFLKSKQLEAKFSAMDILRQNKNISIGSSNNTITTTVTNGLQQFYMLTVAFYPRKFGGGQGGGRRTGTGTPGGNFGGQGGRPRF
ncbi:hypothetical protein ESA94_13890 [Lacibacter luteus]|uniref:Outer membrane protein beta-barrel domain-containing protein n=1 Tax=Lacibacter luteus TaxID=2508719 RepID=A0A4Q1CGE9_9BACT|nr:outer membrane beta-barrel protein [Lacibacter luteus]RXK59228.1 hypothetical protein ESA94_13890 [Lacibacter luteus]